MKGDGILTLGNLIDGGALTGIHIQSPQNIYQEFQSKALQYPCIRNSSFESLLRIIRDQNIQIDPAVYASMWGDFSFKYLHTLFKIINKTCNTGIEEILIYDGVDAEVKPFEYYETIEERQQEDILLSIRKLYKVIFSKMSNVLHEIDFSRRSSEARMLVLRLNELVPSAAELTAYCFLVQIFPDFREISEKAITEGQGETE